MSEPTLEVHPREETGKGASKRLRRIGMLPAVVYGGGKEAVPIQLKSAALHGLLKDSGENAVFLLKLGDTGKRRHTMVRKIDVNSVSRRVEHVDFQRIDLAQKVKVRVHVEVVGEPEGVRNEGGVLDFISREVEVECLPTNIPQKITVDVTELSIGQHLQIKDLEVGEGVEILDELDRVILSVAHSRVAAEVEEFEEGLEAGEELIEAQQEEPEVIGRGKEDESEPAD